MTVIMEAIAKYGIFPVLVATIVYFIVRSFRKQQDMIKKQTAENSALLKMQQEANADQQAKMTEMLAKMLESITKINQNTDPYHTPQEEAENQKVNLLINTQIQKIRSSSNANRVSCFLYHNGGKDAAGRSFQKMSVACESVDINTVPVASLYQNLPRMVFPILVQKLTEQGYYNIEDLESIKDIDAVTYQIFTAKGTKSVFLRAIRTTEHAVMGFLAVEFSTNECEDMGKLKECLLTKAIKISGALEVREDICDIKIGKGDK